jgi:hypothetical protein
MCQPIHHGTAESFADAAKGEEVGNVAGSVADNAADKVFVRLRRTREQALAMDSPGYATQISAPRCREFRLRQAQ